MFVERQPGESFDTMLFRFTRGMVRSGILREYRLHLRFRSEPELRALKAKAAARRRRRRRQERD